VPWKIAKIHSFYFYSASSTSLLLRSAPNTADTVTEFHIEAQQATAIEELAKGPYAAARSEFEPATLRTNGVESTNAPPRPAIGLFVYLYRCKINK